MSYTLLLLPTPAIDLCDLFDRPSLASQSVIFHFTISHQLNEETLIWTQSEYNEFFNIINNFKLSESIQSVVFMRLDAALWSSEDEMRMWMRGNKANPASRLTSRQRGQQIYSYICCKYVLCVTDEPINIIELGVICLVMARRVNGFVVDLQIFQVQQTNQF